MLTPEQIKAMAERRGDVLPEETAVSPRASALQDAWNQYDQQQAGVSEEEKSVGGFLLNIPKSGIELGLSLGEAAIHPARTITELGKVAAGGIQSIPGLKEFFDKAATEKGRPILEENRQAFQNVIGYFGQRYGGKSPEEIVKNIGNTAYKDPVGFAFDLSILFTGGGGILKKGGEISRISKAEQAGRAISRAGEVISPIGQTFNLGKELGGLGIRTSRDLIAKVRDAMALPKISEQVRTIARESTVEKLSEYAEQGYKAIKDPREMTPLELAGQKAVGVLKELNKKLSEAGEKKTEATRAASQKVAYSGDDIIKISENARQGFRGEMPSLGLTLMEDGSLRSAPGRLSRIPLDSPDIALIQRVDNTLKSISKKPTLQAIDDAIDQIQAEIYSRQKTIGAQPINSEVEGIIKRQIGKLNSEAKKLGGTEYAKYNEIYSDLVRIRNDLARGLGKDARSAGAFMKRLFSPADAATKKLFREIYEKTGIDLAKDTTLAKFIMDAVNDVRQKSLLEKIPLSKTTLINRAVESIWEKIATPPIEVLKRKFIGKELPR